MRPSFTLSSSVFFLFISSFLFYRFLFCLFNLFTNTISSDPRGLFNYRYGYMACVEIVPAPAMPHLMRLSANKCSISGTNNVPTPSKTGPFGHSRVEHESIHTELVLQCSEPARQKPKRHSTSSQLAPIG